MHKGDIRFKDPDIKKLKNQYANIKNKTAKTCFDRYLLLLLFIH